MIPPRRRAGLGIARLAAALLSALTAVLAADLAAGGAPAQQVKFDIAGRGTASPVKFTLVAYAWEAEIRLVNADANQRRFRVGTVLRRASDGLSVCVKAARLDGPADLRVVLPNGNAILRLSATLPEPGAFTASLDVSTVATVDGQETERVERQSDAASPAQCFDLDETGARAGLSRVLPRMHPEPTAGPSADDLTLLHRMMMVRIIAGDLPAAETARFVEAVVAAGPTTPGPSRDSLRDGP